MTGPSASDGLSDPAPSADPLERGLAAGFGQRAPESVAGDSVLAALAQRGGATPRVLLRDTPGDELDRAAPLLRPLPAAERERARAAAGRYQFQGEIAHGGMGVILKGHDQDLGRDVAIKVLHERYKDDASLLRRFVEEAQIGGQLQHPGIVPVYELGLHEGRPFFTMKLIKGRTLGALLAERADPSRDRRRYLGIFEQVCQTVAYAHARGVIHRDLKPANVMVGAFGEVQVVDWGMAKVLAQGGVADERKERPGTIATVRSLAGTPPGTSSVAGAVMGTPSYMPPEQATGDLEHMDERSDVFALGAILCEILTGSPPYAGERDEVLAMAAQGALDAARARLARSAAEPELAALVTECLSPALGSRPRTAQAVAERVSAHLASTEQRAQEARIAAAEQGVKAREARRSQRLTLALAASVLVTVLVGGGGYSWIAEQRAARGVAIARQVDETLTEATRLRGQAEAGTAAEVGLWSQARTKAEAARTLAASGDADPALRARVAGLLGELERGATAAQRKAEHAARDRDLVVQLEDISTEIEGDLDTDFTANDLRTKRVWRQDKAYAAAFAEYRIDLQASETEVARQIAASAIATELVLALDHWSLARRTLGDREQGHRLLRIARGIDSDPWRDQLRGWLLGAELRAEELRALVARADPAALAPSTLLLFGRTLLSVRLATEAVALMRMAFLHHPSDFGIAFELGVAELYGSRPEPSEAVRCLTAAVAIRPRSTEARHRLGVALQRAGRIDEALAVFRTDAPIAVRGHWTYHIGMLLRDKGDLDGAIATFRTAIGQEPTNGGPYVELGRTLHQRRDLEGAIVAYRKAIQLSDGNAPAHNNLGSVLADKNDLDGAIAAYQTAIRLSPDADAPLVNLGRALFAKGDLRGAMTSCREAIKRNADYVDAHYTLALALEGSGALADAEVEYRRTIDLQAGHAEAWCNLAHVLRKQRLYAESLQALERGHELGVNRPVWNFPSAEWLSQARTLAEQERPLLAIVRGEASAKDSKQMASAADTAARRKLHARAAQLYAGAFAADPALAGDLRLGHRFEAARMAAAAAGEPGADPQPSEQQRAAWRQQALVWLRDELAAWRAYYDADAGSRHARVERTLRGWQADANLAGLREPGRIEKLPPAELSECQELWRDVQALLDRARPERPPESRR